MSPLLNAPYWQERMGRSTPTYSGEWWLDWEHEKVMRWSLRRALDGIDDRVLRILEAGCADGRWAAWMAAAFGVRVMGTDALEYPGVRKRMDLFIQCDLEQLDKCREAKRFNPNVLLYMNSLTCVADWRKAVQAGAHVGAPWVICFDNFMTPTPAFLKNLPHRRPIQLPALEYEWELHGYEVAQEVAGDWFHRKLFLKTPRWSHPAVAVATLGLDWVASRVLWPDRARHIAVLFEKTSVDG